MPTDAALHFLHQRRAIVNWARVRRVLLIRLRSIGDTVLMTPCLDAIHSSQPSVEIAVVSEPLAAPLLVGHPRIDELIEVERTAGSRLRALRKIRKWGPEVTFNMHGGTTGMIMAALSGAYYTIGFRGQPGSWMLSSPAPPPDLLLGKSTIHSVEQQLALMSWAGVAWPEAPELNIGSDISFARDLRDKLLGLGFSNESLRDKALACVAPGAAFESKRWSASAFAAVVRHLTESWATECLILAGPDQESIAKEVADLSGNHGLVLAGLTLSELTSLLRWHTRIFVGNDSGPMHIASAVGCRVVAVFGSSNPDVWHPWTSMPYRLVGGERGRPDSNIRGSIDSVTINQVTSAVDDLMQEPERVAIVKE
jgi:ADP-heptose:LPS heptosyltransferase